MTGLKDFSLDAASNDISAPPINWQEGMPANVYNNSARAMMAALACWRDDNNGSLGATGAASNTLGVSTNQGFTDADYTSAFDLAFSSDATNTKPCTISPDGASAKPLRRQDGSELAPSDIRPGVIYRARWHPGTGCFTIVSPVIEPAGSIKAFATPGAVPQGWLTCDGAAVSRVSYAALLAAIGGVWGAGDGSTTFNVPDLRGRTLFGSDGGAGRLTAAGGIAAVVGSTGGAEAIALTIDQLASHGHGGSTAGAGAHDHGGDVGAAGQHSHGGSTGNAGAHAHTATADTQGAHVHTGTTNTGGSHSHSGSYAVGTAGSGNTNPTVTNVAGPGLSNGFTTGAGGDHNHGFTTDASGAHAHNIAVAGVGDHAHSVAPDGQHQHVIPAVADHVHGLNISTAGSGVAHPNMPPGAVIVWAIKA